jgi:hypothetical protein
MAYIGQGIKQGTFKVLDTSGNTYNGSNTTFSLGTQVGAAAQLLVSHDGVIQLPGTDYTLASGGTQITFSTAPASGASIFIVEISGAVGGTVTPSDNSVGITQLNVSDGSNGQALTTNGSGTLSFSTISTGLTGIDDQSSSNDDQLTITDTAVVINEDSDDVDFRVESNGNANMLVVNAGGDRVGIGSDPDLGTGLHIKTSDTGASAAGGMDELVIENGSTNAGLSILTATDGIGRIAFGDSGDNAIGGIDYDHGSNYLRFNTSGSERIRIASDGDTSIGTTSNEARLHVHISANQSVLLVNNASTSNADEVAIIQCSRDSSGNYDLLHVRNGGGHVFNVADSGNVQNVNNSYGSLSDERIKQDIADASSQWDDIKALKIRKYKLKKLVNRDGDSAPTHLGVIAQELEASGMNGLVEENKPEKEDVALHSDFGTVVSGTADNGATPIYEKDEEGNDTDKITGYEDVFTAGQNKKEVKYSVLYMKSIKALQEAMTRIETLEAKVKTLEEG